MKLRKFFTQKDFPIGTLIAFEREHTVCRYDSTISPSPKYTTIGLVVGHPVTHNIAVEWLANSWRVPFKEGEVMWMDINHEVFQDAIIQKAV